MKKIRRKLFFADLALSIIVLSVFIYGKISAPDDLQLRDLNPVQKVFHAQVRVSQSSVVKTGGDSGSNGFQNEADMNVQNTENQAMAKEDEMGSEAAEEEADEASNSEIEETKKIALTFDDGPDPEYTPILLDGLRERGVQATFFLLGQQIEMYPEIVEEMCADGHEISVHSYEHVNLEAISEAEACMQIQQTGDLICSLTGEWPAFVRPPYGNWPSAMDNDFSMITVLWDVDPLDWATEDTSLIVQRILENVEEYDIILLHDASESSVQAALQVIDILRQENYQFVTVEELIFP